jgi:hypothetical protein
MATSGHTYKVGETVVYKDGPQGKAYTAEIVSWEPTGKTTWNVHLTNLVSAKTGKPESWGVGTTPTHIAPLDSLQGREWLSPPKHLTPGTVVRITLTGAAVGKTYGGVSHGDLAVVLQDKGERVNVAKLGGSPTGRDSYGRFPHSMLAAVPLAELAAVLA